MSKIPKKLKDYHWTIKGSIIAVFVAALAVVNLILSIDFATYSINYKWLLLLLASAVFFIVCSIVYINNLDNEL